MTTIGYAMTPEEYHGWVAEHGHTPTWPPVHAHRGAGLHRSSRVPSHSPEDQDTDPAGHLHGFDNPDDYMEDSAA